EGKYFTAALIIRNATPYFGTSPSPKRVRNAPPLSCWKRRQRKKALSGIAKTRIVIIKWQSKLTKHHPMSEPRTQSQRKATNERKSSILAGISKKSSKSWRDRTEFS